ncbi:hypothetical protein ARTHRO9AX_220462 [Arthrobacter sp. 9AX]|nr:hypothetical protein ARTHRO9AX_220462 [Arthrobacter sp. 9AX]
MPGLAGHRVNLAVVPDDRFLVAALLLLVRG